MYVANVQLCIFKVAVIMLAFVFIFDAICILNEANSGKLHADLDEFRRSFPTEHHVLGSPQYNFRFFDSGFHDMVCGRVPYVLMVYMYRDFECFYRIFRWICILEFSAFFRSDLRRTTTKKKCQWIFFLRPAQGNPIEYQSHTI